MARRRNVVSDILALHKSRVPPGVLQQRIAERDARVRADMRTEAQRWLGDPDPQRSALNGFCQRLLTRSRDND